MRLARVMGTVVATQKYGGLQGIKFLIVQPLSKQQEPLGEPVVAADATGGDVVGGARPGVANVAEHGLAGDRASARTVTRYGC